MTAKTGAVFNCVSAVFVHHADQCNTEFFLKA